MKKVLLALALSFSASTSMAATLTPGQNAAVQRVQWAWGYFPRWIASCVDLSARCGLTADEQKLLRDILSTISSYKADSVKFISGNENPGHFELADAAHRLAITGSEVGGTIDWNTDLIESVSLGDAVALITHELGHHHGYKDTADRPLDQLGSKVRALFEAQTETISLRTTESADGFKPQVSVHSYALSDDGLPEKLAGGENALWPVIWVPTQLGLTDLSDKWVGRPFCPFGTFKVNVWLRGLRTVDLPQGTDPNTQDYQLSANVEDTCQAEGSAPQRFTNSTASLDLKFQKEGSLWNLSKDSSLTFVTNLAPSVDSQIVVTKWSSSANEVKDGETWTYQAEIQSNLKLEEHCHLNLGASDLSLIFPSTFFGECNTVATTPGNYRVSGTFKIPEITPSRKYFVSAISVYSREVGDYGGFVDTHPTLRPELAVKSAHIPDTAQLVSIGLVTKYDKDHEKKGMVGVLWSADYMTRIRTRNAGDYTYGTLTTQLGFTDGRVIPYSFNPADWFMFAHGQQVQTTYQKDGDSITEFIDTQRDDLTEDPDTLQSIEYTNFKWITTQLQEMNIDFKPQEMGLKLTPGVVSDDADWGN